MPVPAGTYNISMHNHDELNKSYHQERSNNPIDNDAESNLDPDTTLSEDMVQRFVPYFAKNRIHHDQETDRLHRLAEASYFYMHIHTDWNRHPNKCPFLQGRAYIFDKIA